MRYVRARRRRALLCLLVVAFVGAAIAAPAAAPAAHKSTPAPAGQAAATAATMAPPPAWPRHPQALQPPTTTAQPAGGDDGRWTDIALVGAGVLLVAGGAGALVARSRLRVRPSRLDNPPAAEDATGSRSRL